MSTSAVKTEPVVTQAIQEINHLATLPEVTLRIVELVENPSSTAQDLQRVISNDPALCSRILKVVNSAFYGLPGQIGSIDRAIVLLGLNAVKNIAVAASLVKLFRGGDLGPSFSARDLWTHSVATATASKCVAEHVGLGMADEAFLGGLMHDVGVIVELQFDRQKLGEVIDRVKAGSNGVPTHDMMTIEREVFGATHQQFGEALCQRWKFPAGLCTTAGQHHEPLTLPEDRRMVPCVVYVADRIAAGLKQGFRLDLLNTEMDDAVLEHIGLERTAIEDLTKKVKEHLDDVKSMLS